MSTVSDYLPEFAVRTDLPSLINWLSSSACSEGFYKHADRYIWVCQSTTDCKHRFHSCFTVMYRTTFFGIQRETGFCRISDKISDRNTVIYFLQITAVRNFQSHALYIAILLLFKLIVKNCQTLVDCLLSFILFYSNSLFVYKLQFDMTRWKLSDK